jgi:hypothetical protein
MPRWADDEDDDQFDHAEEGFCGDEEEPTVPCPYCHREIHEDSQRCPHCENYISQEHAPQAHKPWWLVVGVLVCLLLVYLWITG